MKTKLAAAAGLMLLIVTQGFAQGPNAPFTITITMDNTTVTAGSAVQIKIEMTNTSSQDVDCTGVPSNGLDRAYRYDVRSTAGKVMPKLARKHPEIGETFSSWPCVLQPGETKDAAGGLISQLYDFSAPGEYVLQVERPISQNPGAAVVKSNKLTIWVVQ